MSRRLLLYRTFSLWAVVVNTAILAADLPHHDLWRFYDGAVLAFCCYAFAAAWSSWSVSS